jgi:hypothetical protein
MSSLSAKDRASLCSSTFADGRRCRTPRTRNHPHFSLYHAQKEARASVADILGKDLAYFFIHFATRAKQGRSLAPLRR